MSMIGFTCIMRTLQANMESFKTNIERFILGDGRAVGRKFPCTFDKILLDNSKLNGAFVLEETLVKSVELEHADGGVLVQTNDNNHKRAQLDSRNSAVFPSKDHTRLLWRIGAHFPSGER